MFAQFQQFLYVEYQTTFPNSDDYSNDVLQQQADTVKKAVPYISNNLINYMVETIVDSVDIIQFLKIYFPEVSKYETGNFEGQDI